MSTSSRGRRGPSTRVVALGILVVALVLAGIVSFYAASTPDGLTKVSEDQGFAETETEHGAGDGPFAGYGSSFIDDERLSGGVAGVVGVLVVLLLGTGLTYAVRRRPSSGTGTDTGTDTDTDTDPGAGADRGADDQHVT